MVIPKVVLIGGSPFAGKSATARCLAARYGYCCIPTDDIGQAIGAVTTARTHPELHLADDSNYQEYFTVTSFEDLIDHSRQAHGIIWPALEKIVQTHSAWGAPLVMEGYALWPERVKAAQFSSTGAVWLACDDQLLETRIRSDTSFYQGAADEEALIENVLRRSSRYNELMVASAVQCGSILIDVEAGHSVDDVADLCVSALS